MITHVERASDASVPPAATAVRLVAYAAVAWCLGFAAVNAWFLVTGPGSGHALEEHGAGLAAMNVLVLVLKLLGAGLAVASVARTALVPPRLLATGLWGASASLALYAVGSLAITVANVSGLLAPSAAWEAPALVGGVLVGAPWVLASLGLLPA